MARLDLHKIRKDFGLTQKSLSKLTGYPQSYISYVERGRADASKAFLQKLEDTLHLADINTYIIKEETQQGAGQQSDGLNLITINKLLNMLEDRDRRIKELESEVFELRSMIHQK